MRLRLGEAFIANTSVLENCSAELVSADREVGRAYHDPRNFAALRLTKEMQKLRRVVEIIRADDLPKRFEERIAQKFLYGDFQFSVDEKSPDFLQRGVFSCYEPISEDEPIVAKKELRDDDWLDLLRLAYTDRKKAFKRYSDYYLSTNGQTYWSDTNQLSAYLPNYAQKIRDQIGGDESSLIITEIYVPRPDLPDFLAQAADLLRSNRTTVIYGTVRLIEKDDESFLAWAKAILRLYHFQFAHAPYTERHRSVGAFVPRLNRFGDSSRRKLLPDVSQICETRAGHRVLSAIQRISGPETKVRSELNDFRAIGIAIIGSFSQADEFLVMLSEAKHL